MNISASLYSGKNKSLVELVESLDDSQVDMFHIDCKDNPAVFDDIEKIKSISKTPIDLHLISPDPEKYLQDVKNLQVEYLTLQYENLPSDYRMPKLPGTRLGLAVVSDTPLEVFEPFAPSCDFILLMTTVPGESGGVFRKDNFKRIRKFSKLYPSKKVHVDGGVNAEVSFILRTLGVHSVVSGSYLVNHESLGHAMLHLRSSEVKSDYRVKDFMMDRVDLKILNPNTTDFAEVISNIEEQKLGFALFCDEQNYFKGISSNADVRKALLNNLQDLNAIPPQELINPSPVSIHEDANIDEMLKLIKSKPFLISFMPVVNSKNQLTGALTFYQLIKGES